MGKLSSLTLAFHGDSFFLDGPSLLQRDMGDPSWVDWYPDWKNWTEEDRRDLRSHHSIILIGYSRGGGYISDLTHYLKDRIRCCILYESPVLSQKAPWGLFPTLHIWNNRSRWAKSKGRKWSDLQWGITGRKQTFLVGKGPHMKWFPLGHGWDRTLNPAIEKWILSTPTKYF